MDHAEKARCTKIAAEVLADVVKFYHPTLKVTATVKERAVLHLLYPSAFRHDGYCGTPPPTELPYKINLSQLTLSANNLIKKRDEFFKISLNLAKSYDKRQEAYLQVDIIEIAKEPVFAIVFKLLAKCFDHPMVGITIKDGNPPTAHIFIRYEKAKDNTSSTNTLTHVELVGPLLKFKGSEVNFSGAGSFSRKDLHSIDIGDPDLEAKLTAAVKSLTRTHLTNLVSGARRAYKQEWTSSFSGRIGLRVSRKRFDQSDVQHLVALLRNSTMSRVGYLRRLQRQLEVLKAFDEGRILDA